MNIGEEIATAYLQYIKECEFIQKNLYIPEVQGEIDVVGIDVNNKTVYVCEVAVHLITGLQYVKNKRPNNINKLYEKFSKDIEYTNKYFPDYKKIFMIWSPIVKNQSEGSKYNQLNDISEIKLKLKEKYEIELIDIINEKFLNCLKELREFASQETKDIKSPVIRYLQVEEYTKKHVKKLGG